MPTAPPVACRCGRLDCTIHGRDTKTAWSALPIRPKARPLYHLEVWRRTRLFILARDPLCMINRCVERYGIRMPSTIVDHKVAIIDGGAELDQDNLQGVCHACHTSKTAKEIRERRHHHHE